MTFGEFLRSKRTQKGWSRYRLSKLSKVDKTMIGKYEDERVDPTIKTAQKLCIALEEDFVIKCLSKVTIKESEV